MEVDDHADEDDNDVRSQPPQPPPQNEVVADDVPVAAWSPRNGNPTMKIC
jgi:hypothetical protein